MNSHHNATLHWLLQRATALALLPLTLSFLQFIHASLTLSYTEMLAWIAVPFHTSCLMAWFLIVCYHTALGLQVVIEDYVAKRDLQSNIILIVKIGFGLIASIAVLLLLTLSVR